MEVNSRYFGVISSQVLRKCLFVCFIDFLHTAQEQIVVMGRRAHGRNWKKRKFIQATPDVALPWVPKVYVVFFFFFFFFTFE